MATFVKFRDLLCLVCFLSNFQDICSGSAVWQFNGTAESLRPDEQNVHELQLLQNLVYFQKIYSKLYITKDGLVGFSKDTLYKPVDYSSTDLSPFVKEPFIAPYHYNGEGFDLVQHYTGQVTYHQFNTSSSSNPVNPSVLWLGQYVRSQVVGSNHFHPDWALQITWSNVTSAEEIGVGGCTGSNLKPCSMNTFQLVLLSDGRESYAIFNYGSININPRQFDQAGFFGGRGSGWYGVFIRGLAGNSLTNQQASDTPGRYIFKISSASIVRGGCSPHPESNQLSVYPTYAGMFGGRMIDIAGPCFTNNLNNIKCRFGQNSDSPTCIRISTTRIRCVVPYLSERGRIKLSLSVNGGGSFPFETTFTVVNPGRVPSPEYLSSDDGNNAWFDYKANQIVLKWTPEKLSNSSRATVNISLIGYRETSDQIIFTKIHSFGSTNAGAGRYTFNSDENICSDQTCFDFEEGLFEVRLRDPEMATKNLFIVSRPVPLGWFVRQAMESRHGSNWQSALCTNWYDQDKQYAGWLQNLLSCPCTLTQALADFGRWQPDNVCRLVNKGKAGNCKYHQGAAHCVRAVQPVGASGNQCCYTASGILMFAADTFHGSTPDRSHDWGAAPYGKPDYVPSMSHWLHDVVSFYYCCMWTEFGPDCNKYMDLRPTSDCTGYSPPRPASVFGQGHLMTYSGIDYRMYGPGDYVLVRAGDTVIQGRFKRNPLPTENNDSITDIVALTGIAIQDKGANSDKVEIRLRLPPAKRDTQRLDVRVNGEAVMFDNGAMAWQDFTGVAVVNTDITDMVQSNFTVIMSNGIGFQVSELQRSNILQLDLMIPTNTFTNVSGLFGDLSGNLMTSNGTILDLSKMAASSQYNRFQLSWAVNESDSLFVDFLPANNSLLGPVYLDPPVLPGASVSQVPSGCNKLCVFDYLHTKSRTIASLTNSATERFEYLSQSTKLVRSCGLLNVPRATKTSYNYILGTTATITGCRTGSLSGDTTYTCTATSNVTQAWSPPVTATCEVPTDTANVGMIVGIVVAVVVVVVLAIVIALLLRNQRRRSAQKRSGQPQNEKEMETLKTNV